MSNQFESQKGVSLVIMFFIMTIILAIVLNITIILFNEVRMISGIGNYLASFYAADSAIEKTLYFDRKQIPSGAVRGFCDMCTACAATTGDCTGCSMTGSDCGISTCTSCQVDFVTYFSDASRSYVVHTTTAPNVSDSAKSDTIIDAKGLYKDITRQIRSSYTTP